MQLRTGTVRVFGSLVIALAATACDNTARGVKEDSAEMKREATEASADASRKAGEATDSAADAARRGADGATGAIDNAGRAGDAAIETLDVKSALIGDSRIDSSNINVDTDHVTKTVVLKGYVPTDQQRTWAGEVAERKAVGYRVDNQLTVRAS